MKEYPISDRAYTYTQSLTHEYCFSDNKNYLFSLEYLSALQVDGNHSMTFLQGQLSCDMRLVNPLYMQQGVMCNLKGRILAIMDVVCTDNNVFSLVLPHDIRDDVQARLTKPALLSRVKIDSVFLKIYGLYVQNETICNKLNINLPLNRYEVIRRGEMYVYKMDTAFYLLMIPEVETKAFERIFVDDDAFRGSLGWHALQLQHQRVEIYPSSQGLFLPHRLNLHQTGFLAFDKGCYKGQEIIARMHFRSTQKHTLVSLVIRTDATMSLGVMLYAEDGETPIGELIDFSPISSDQWLINASLLISSKPQYLIVGEEIKHRLDIITRPHSLF